MSASAKPAERENETGSALSKPGQPKGWRKWIYRAIAVVGAPTLIFGLLELGLLTFDYGHATSFFKKGRAREREDGFFVENVDFGKLYFPPGLVQKTPPLVMPAGKSSGVRRIFVLGESAAMGFPDPSTSFARILEVMLREARPDISFEVINTSLTAINSHAVLPIARECSGHQPDYFLVHMGNNEVVGAFGAAGVLGAYSPSLPLIRLSLAARRTRTGQLLHNALGYLAPGEGPRSWDGMAMFQKSRVGSDDPRLHLIRANFRQNLVDICKSGVNAGAEVLVCTIPVNLKDCAPFASLHAENLDDDRKALWEKLYSDGIGLETEGKFAMALERFEAATRIDDRFADLPFRMARCLLAFGRKGEARAAFSLARDHDALRFRTDSTANAIIRAVTSEFQSHVYLVDAENEFELASTAGFPGEDLFLEHVHMNFTGNYVLARSAFRELIKLLPPPALTQKVAKNEPLTEQVCAERLAWVSWRRLKSESVIRSMFRDPPFRDQLDQKERGKRWDARLAELRRNTDDADKTSDSCRVFEKALEQMPRDWILREGYAQFLADRGDLSRAIEEYEKVTRQVPHHYEAHRQLGNLLFRAGESGRALLSLDSALAIDPNLTFAHYDKAQVLAALGRRQEALTTFGERVRREPDRAEALALLASFHLSLGETGEAKERASEALAINPNAVGANMMMGHLLGREGAIPDAVRHYETALRARPRLESEVTRLIADLHNKKVKGNPAPQ